MKVLDQTRFAELGGLRRPVHIAIGMFDGLHLGHQSVIQSAIRSAELDGGLSAVLTFFPHPSHLFRPEDPTPQIYPAAVKEEILRELGVDFTLRQAFDPGFASMTAAQFTDWLCGVLPRLASVSVGENFRFGKGRGGSPSVLVDRLHRRGVSVYSCERVHLDGEPISSTRIRGLIPREPIEKVNALLGRPYCSIGTVTEGRRLGRTIGFPTLNLPVDMEIQPLRGVYVARCRRLEPKRGVPRAAVANFGVRPTVEEGAPPLLEVHCLEEPPAGYGDRVLVEWIRLIRPEKKFSGVEELRAAIAADRESALRAHGGLGGNRFGDGDPE